MICLPTLQSCQGWGCKYYGRGQQVAADRWPRKGGAASHTWACTGANISSVIIALSVLSAPWGSKCLTL